MSFRLKKGRALDSINLTPLIDVMFFLLTFFLMSTELIKDSENELSVKLPSASSALPITMEPETLVINIDVDGQYIIRGQRLPLASVEAIVAQSVLNNPINQVVIIRGDRRVEFQSVISITDVCNRLKVPSYKFSTETETIE